MTLSLTVLVSKAHVLAVETAIRTPKTLRWNFLWFEEKNIWPLLDPSRPFRIPPSLRTFFSQTHSKVYALFLSHPFGKGAIYIVEDSGARHLSCVILSGALIHTPSKTPSHLLSMLGTIPPRYTKKYAFLDGRDILHTDNTTTIFLLAIMHYTRKDFNLNWEIVSWHHSPMIHLTLI